MKQQVSEDMKVVADLEQQYQFPPSLAAFTDLQPDLVAYSCLAKTAIIVELTVCFETDGFCQLRDSVGASQSELNELLHSVSLAAIKGSFQIWTCRNHVNVE